MRKKAITSLGTPLKETAAQKQDSTEKQGEIHVWIERLEELDKELRAVYVDLSVRLIPILRSAADELRQEEPRETQSPLGSQLEEIASNLRGLLRDLRALENNVEL